MDFIEFKSDRIKYEARNHDRDMLTYENPTAFVMRMCMSVDTSLIRAVIVSLPDSHVQAVTSGWREITSEEANQPLAEIISIHPSPRERTV